MQLASRGNAIDLCHEVVALRQIPLGGVYKVGKGLLHGRWRTEAIPVRDVRQPVG